MESVCGMDEDLHLGVGRDTARKVDAFMNLTTLHAKVLPSLLGGTSRHPMPGEVIHPSSPNSDRHTLKCSVYGKALRFERPSTPESFIVKPEIKDKRKIIAEVHVRRPLSTRLLTSKNAAEHPARALARGLRSTEIASAPIRPAADRCLCWANAEKLGPAAQHWADRQKPEAETRSYLDPELLDESNWKHATLSRRVAYLEERRRVDADAAVRWLNPAGRKKRPMLASVCCKYSRPA